MELVEGGLELLTEDECLRLVATRPIGRVAVTLAALPAVFPVNFTLAGRDVYFRTGAGTKFDAAVRQAVVAFEVDDFDVVTHSGWSVMLVGMVADVTDHERETFGGHAAPVRAWARGDRDRLMRVSGEIITGRRVSYAV
jgi:nitroimidazol reductase NimA-like FMN-containing flavoprotein (pyridoxamine 5'-phosphate oxidase superfamily)